MLWNKSVILLLLTSFNIFAQENTPINEFIDNALLAGLNEETDLNETRRKLLNFFETTQVIISGLQYHNTFENDLSLQKKYDVEPGYYSNIDNPISEYFSNLKLSDEENKTSSQDYQTQASAGSVINNPILEQLTLEYLAFKMSDERSSQDCSGIHNAYNSLLIISSGKNEIGPSEKESESILLLTHINYLLSRENEICNTNNLYSFGVGSFKYNVVAQKYECTGGWPKKDKCEYRPVIKNKSKLYANSSYGRLELSVSKSSQNVNFTYSGQTTKSQDLLKSYAQKFKSL